MSILKQIIFNKRQFAIIGATWVIVTIFHIIIRWIYNGLPVVITYVNNSCLLPAFFILALLSERLPHPVRKPITIGFAISLGLTFAGLVTRWLEAYILM